MKPHTDQPDTPEDDIVYSITPLGLLHLYLGEEKARDVLDQFKLHMLRHGEIIAMIPGEEDPQFVKLARKGETEP
jgi:hypothetical protein